MSKVNLTDESLEKVNEIENVDEKSESENEEISDENNNEELDQEESETSEDEDDDGEEKKERKVRKNGFKKRIERIKRRELEARRDADYWRQKALENEKRFSCSLPFKLKTCYY